MRDRILAALVAVGAVCYLYADYQIPRTELGDPLGPRAFPALIGILLLISAALLALETRRLRPAAPAAAVDQPPRGGHHFVLAAMLAWTVCYYTVFEIIGYVIATIIYLFALLCYFHAGRHVTNALVAIGFTVIAYGVFSQFLGVQLPPGPLGF